ncbi:concanavalin A-like lectin/glucanase domain-containing protein [Mycena crocata]|nr:concanavalin A-like lectin/glucanase domain-containing protein [Mycena crocata]
MSGPRPAPLSFAPLPPNPPFAHTTNNTDSEPPSPTAPAPGSTGTSPPVTPRSLSFLTPPIHTAAMPNPFGTPPGTSHGVSGVYGAGFSNNNGNAQGGGNGNPFSPPASVRSFSHYGGGGGQQTPHGQHTPGTHSFGSGAGSGYPFPSPDSTRASSLVDVPRAFASNAPASPASSLRPLSATPSTHHFSSLNLNGGASTPGGTPGGGGTTTPTGQGTPARRDTFASPPARPLTIYAQAHSSGTIRARPVRPKSTALLVPSSSLSLESTAPSARTAYTVEGSGEEVNNEKMGMKRGKGGKKSALSKRPTLRATLDKPWVGTRDPAARVAYLVTYATILLGLAAGAARIYTGWKGVLLLQDNLCPVVVEDFSSATTESLFGDGGLFFREVDASGFGNGEFEMTTSSASNSFVRDGQLFLVPTLTSEVIPEGSILDGAVYNLTDCTYNVTHSSGYTTAGHGSAGINTTEGMPAGAGGGEGIAPDAPLDLAAYLRACSAVSNATEGRILPPVMSARISTRRSASLKFGRVEVRAKLPTGDWMWPAIWMLPVDSAYGGWPLSGEIDIMEARGNGPSYPKQGVNYVRSALNWGPAPFLNAVAKTYGWATERRARYDDDFHTYALEWNEEFIRMYVDSRLKHMFELKLSKSSFWDRGDFPTVVQNGSESVVLANPWVNGTKAAPFDQPFYLILNVAVGGTNGWFPDGPEKPWLDGSATAPLDFLRAQNQWYPTWPQDVNKRAMVVDSVKMWEKC